MRQRPTNKPRTLVSQTDRNREEPGYSFPAADFVFVDDTPLHLWVDGIHFVEDPDGDVREGQYFLVRDPGHGVTVSQVERYDDQDGLATVRHLYHWYDGELDALKQSERWSIDEITGDYDRAMGDGSRSTFLYREG